MKYLILDDKKNVYSWGDSTEFPFVKEGYSLVGLSDLQYKIYDACKGNLQDVEIALGNLKSIVHYSTTRLR